MKGSLRCIYIGNFVDDKISLQFIYKAIDQYCIVIVYIKKFFVDLIY